MRRAVVELMQGAVAIAAALSAACRSDPPKAAVDPPAPAAWFEERASATGIDFRQTTGHVPDEYLFPESVCGGVGLFDYDNDGDLDLYLVQAGNLRTPAKGGNRLYRNRGDASFEDVTSAAGVGGAGYGMGCTCGDYDADGHIDLFVTTLGPSMLYRNNGNGTFSDVTAAAGVGPAIWGCSSAFVDYDGDGDLDLLVTNYVRWSAERELKCVVSGRHDYCSPNNYNAPLPAILYRNNGDGTFTDVSEAAGLRKAFGNGMGVACWDFNGDGRMDLFVANDGMLNQLWINDGNGHFADRALVSGCAVSREGLTRAGMGVALADIDDDGDADLLVSHLRQEANGLFVNNGGSFEDAAAVAGLGSSSVPFTGFGAGFADFDNDGRLDVYVANGGVTQSPQPADPSDPYAEPNLLFRGIGNGRFEEVRPRGGTARLLVHASRGAAFGDLDNDGGVDIVVNNKDAAPYVLHNVVPSRGNWVMFRVRNKKGVDAVGAAVRIEAGGAVHRRLVNPAYSFCASNDPRVHCGLGTATSVDRVVVRWPSGREESFGPFKAGATYDLREGVGR